MTTDPKDAEIARLSASRIDIAREADRLQARTEKAEAKVITLTEQVDAIAAHRDEVMAERDAALAQVAAAYEAAAQIAENDKTLHEWEHTAAIRALTPADALAALSRRDALMRAEGARVTVKPGEIERAVWSAMIWAASNNAGFNGVPEYTDRGNSFAEDEARRAAARILAALLPAGEKA